MKGDFTRFTFDPKKHYSGVFKQQGRVDLDADWNEYVEMQRYIDRVRTRDIIGPCGVPINGKGDEELGGFKVTADEQNDDLKISPGNIYVDGILCQLEDSTTYLDQKDHPGRPELDQSGTDLVYLDVWMRHITAIEDPEIKETALGGPDTTTRIKTVWQVKVAKVDEDVQECADVKSWGQLSPTMPSQGQLSTSLSPVGDTVNPCALIAEGGYSGLENRLYRVEIHNGGDTHALLNPISPGKHIGLHPVEKISGANELTMKAEGLVTQGPAWAQGQVVEVSSDRADGQFRSILSRIVKVDNARHVLTVDTDLSDMVGDKNFNIKKVATFKWSRDNGSVVFPVEEFGEDDRKIITLKRLGRDQVLTLHNGDWVEVLDDVSELSGRPGTMAQIVGEPNQARFTISLSQEIPKNYQAKDHSKVRRWDQKSGAIVVNTDSPIYLEDGIKIQFSGSELKTGDYWVFAARTTGEVEALVNAPPRRIEHHYCKLALIKWTANEDGSVTAEVTDCRKKFKPLTELAYSGSGCCTVTVGDGTISKGDFNSIQDAIDSVIQKGGGRVCILPGSHKLLKTITINEFLPKNEIEEVHSHPHKGALTIYGCGPQTQIFGPKNLDPAFHLDNSELIHFDSLTIEVDLTQIAISFDQCNSIRISDCIINIAEIDQNEEIGDISPLMISDSRDIIIENNFFICPRTNKYAAIAIKGNAILFSGNKLSHVGIWIQDSSHAIFIQENLIYGASAGIILGGKTSALKAGQVVGITITDNLIIGMDNSGICTRIGEIDIVDLIIDRNRILGSAQKGIDEKFHTQAVGGIVLQNVSRVRIYRNIINGRTLGKKEQNHPACGIFICMCQGLEIKGNEIIDNGISIKPDNSDNFYQAGIVALNITGGDSSAGSLDQPMKEEQDTLPHFSAGFPAALISDNVVITPSGHALIIIGMGQMLIEANSLTTKGKWSQPFSYKNGPKILNYDINSCVFILNLGLSIAFPHLTEVSLSGTEKVAKPKNESHNVTDSNDPVLFLYALGKIYGANLHGPVLFQSNQVALQIEDKHDLETLIDMKNPDINFIKLMMYLSLSSRITELCGNIGPFNTDLAYQEKSISTTEDIPEEIKNALINTLGTSVIIASLDDISFQNNQITTMVRGRFLVGDVIAAAPTIRASGNRLSEEPISLSGFYGTLLSLCSVGFLNITNDNQANNCLIALGRLRSKTNNQIIFNRHCSCLQRVATALVENLVEGEISPAIEREVVSEGLVKYPETIAPVVGEYSFKYFYNYISETLTSVMLSFADEYTKSAENLNTVVSKAKELQQTDDHIIMAFQRRAMERVEKAQTLRTTAMRLAGISKMEPKDWMVIGRILDQEGKPVQEVIVKVFDHSEAKDNTLGDATTNENGDFEIIYHERDFLQVERDSPNLFLEVIDAGGQTLYSPEKLMRNNARKIEYFEIALKRSI